MSGPERLADRLVSAACVGLLLSAAAARPASAAPMRIGRVSVAGGGVEGSTDGRQWKVVTDGTLLRTGDRIRCDATSLARFDIGWAKLTLGPDSEITIPASKAISIRLEAGRLEQISEGSDIVKMRTEETLVQGKGHVVMRRQGELTTVSARLGRFRVEGGRQSVRLEPGFGTAVRRGQAPLSPRHLTAPPEKLVPASDPMYVDRNQPIQLEWVSDAKAYEVELITVGSDTAVLQVAAGPPPVTLTVPWPGTYRWRVAARDEVGIEGQPSRSGLICVLDW